MMKRIVGVFSVILVLCAVFSMIPTGAVTFDCPVKTYSDSILLVNLDSDMVVYDKDSDTKRYPASLTKIMTFIVAAEYFDDYDNTRVEVKQETIDYVNSSGMSCSGLEWHIGKKMTVTDLLYALMVPLGHDSALVLSDYIGSGNTQTFVDMMNQKAKALGCKNTHFTNPTGVHDDNHYTTARDLYIMTDYAMGLPLFSQICATSTYYLEGDDYPIVTTNYMIDSGRGGDYFYTYATGVKNGTTTESGRCLISTAVYDGYAYMYIGLHAPYDEEEEENEQYCMTEAAEFFRWAFINLSFVTQATKDTPVCEQSVEHAWDTESILLVPETDLNIILPSDYKEGDVTITPDSTKAVSAPIKKGEIITTATVYYKGEAFTKINLVAQQSIKVSPILYVTDLIKSILTSVWFLISVLVVVVLFVVYIYVSSSYSKSKGKTDKRRRYKK